MQPLAEWAPKRFHTPNEEYTYHWHLCLLRASNEWPRKRCSAKCRYEVSPPHLTSLIDDNWARVSDDLADAVGQLLHKGATESSFQVRTLASATNMDADYSITSSARASRPAGSSIPSAFAVLILITSSNLVGCSMGRSAGF